MKKKKFNGKLVLNKKTIANLNSKELDNLRGGTGDPPPTIIQICESQVICGGTEGGTECATDTGCETNNCFSINICQKTVGGESECICS
ncbi:MAG: class I lanthipeptide [Bacteroidales bacterium]|nr:class I lanthipeptide [Bacteroidales bacterium]